MKNDRRRPIKFKGFDWTELLQLQRIAIDWPEVPKNFKNADYPLTSDEDAKNAYLITQYLKKVEIGSKEEKLVAKYVRRFLVVLAQQDKAWGRDEYIIYLALTKTSDSTMIGWVSRNLECMWT
jgi:hypothetical protein